MAGAHRWIFTTQELFNTPSREAGIDAEKELNYRQQCANLIQDMGQRLQVTQLCINTAIVYMHRFYMFHGFSTFHRNPMAEACLFLAAKVEEQPRKLEHVIKSYHLCVNRDQGSLDIKSEAYLEMAQELVCNENILLQTLGFDISVEHPHQNVVKTCTLVKASKDLAQTSYFLATNSLHLTTMCLKYRHTVVACVCIHLACKWSNYQIPCSSEGKHWFEYVDKDVTLTLLEDLTQEFLNILDNCPSKLKKKILTWKSGQRPAEDVMAGGATMEKKMKLEPSATISKPPEAGPSGANRVQQRPGEGLRRVQTEPALAHKEAAERKDRGKHPLPPGTHHREIPGYHNKPSAGAPPGWSAGRPTHPPPKPRGHGVPPGSKPPPPGSQRPQPHRPPTATPEKPRSNIFEQLASEQKPGPRLDLNPGQQPGDPPQHKPGIPTHPGDPTAKQPHPTTHPMRDPTTHQQRPGDPLGHQRRPGDPSGHQPPGGQQPRPTDPNKHPGASKRPGSHPDPKHSHNAPPHTSHRLPPGAIKADDKPPSPTLTTQEKILAAHAAKVKKQEERIAAASHKSPGGATGLTHGRPEQDMQQKLQAELKKQQELEKIKRIKLDRERKERQLKAEIDGVSMKSPTELKSPTSAKSPKLRSPPMFGRQKSDSLSSRSDSDSNTPSKTKEERHKMFMDQQNKIQDDRNRLRRMSEELGDPKIEQKPVVMLDNVLVSPDKGKPELLSPTAEQTNANTPTAGNKPGDANTPTPNRTISLSKYWERKPLSQSQSRTGTPTPGESSSQSDRLDKPTLAMEHLANIKLTGLKPLNEILKPTDIKSETPVKPESPRKPKYSKSSGGESGRKSSNTLLSRKSSSSLLSEQAPAKDIAPAGVTKLGTISGQKAVGTPPGESLEKKLSLKIKIGGVTMSPSLEPKIDKALPDTREQHKSHREGKHDRKRHKHDKDHRKEVKDKSYKQHDPVLGDPSGDLKVKLNLKNLKQGADSPFKIDNPNKPSVPNPVATATSANPAAATAIQPMKLVIQKDKSGHYSSSGHKHKQSRHHDKPRKRSHSPAGSNPPTPVVPIKVARGDPTLGLDVNGANSPAADLQRTVQGVEKLIALQKKNIEKTIKTGGSSNMPSPVTNVQLPNYPQQRK